MLGALSCGAPCPADKATKLGVLEVEEPAARALLLEPSQRAAHAGAQELAVVASGMAAQGDRVGGFVAIPGDGGHCVVLFARSSKTVLDVDLFVFDDEGAALAADESSQSDAGLLLCPPLPSRLYVAGRVAGGAGRVAVGAQLVPLDRREPVAEALGARMKLDETGKLDNWPGLEARLVAHRRALGGRFSDVWRSATVVDPQAPTRMAVTIDRGRCVDVFVSPADDVASLDVTVEDTDGRVFARADVEGRDRTVVVCSDEGEAIALVLRPRGGAAGLAAIVLGRSERGVATEVERTVRVARTLAHGSPEQARLAASQALDANWGKATAVGGGEARVGAMTSFKVNLAPGCSRVEVLAGAPLGPLASTLWSERGELYAESDGAARVTLYACVAESEIARLDVESRGRPGPFVVDRRVWANPPAALAKYPRALARLLERVVGGASEAPSVVATATPVPVVEEVLARVALSVDANGCADVIGALDSGASGLTLGLVDEVLGETLLGRGRFVASQSFCTSERTARDLRSELRVDAGRSTALLLVLPVRD